MSGLNTNLSSVDFNDRVLARPGVWLVDFTATWCPPCRQLAPVLTALGESYAGRVAIAEIDVDDESELSARFQVQSAPTLMLFRDGVVIERRVGASSRQALSAWIDKALA
jgi:thioredoxin 1